jgi:DNA polymerase III alpha subunit
MSTKKSFITLMLLSVITLPVLAQNEMPKYDPKTEVTIKGTVVETKEIANPKGKADVHLMVKSGEDVLEVCLCPLAFLKEFEVTFNKGDQLVIVGSKVKAGDHDVVLAREIEHGNDKTVLRDKEGAPVWTYMTK